ncbi:MAG TPA: hypothetical protein VGJ94_02760 [Syntrophorhabdaceae bacterium]|jgi:hypothetical protein
MERFRLLAAFGLLSLALSGCAAGRYEYRVAVISTVYYSSSGNVRYVLLPCNKDMDHSLPRFEDFAPVLADALEDIGFYEAESIDTADMVLLAAWGLGSGPPSCEPRLAAAGPDQKALIPVQYDVPSSQPITAVASRGSFPPARGVPATPSRRFLVLMAVSREPFQMRSEIVPLWKTFASSTGYITDLGIILPVLLEACKPYIGTAMETQITLPAGGEVEEAGGLKEGTP